MRISLYTSERDQEPKTIDVTWADHTDGLSQCREVECPKTTLNAERQEIPSVICPSLTPGSANKCEARKGVAWSPAITDGQRGDAHVIGADTVTLDVDHVTQAELNRIDDRITSLGWAFIIHSTHSHNPSVNDWCARIVVRCARTMTRAEIKPTRDWVQAQLGMRADESTKNEERLYYLPSRPKGGPPYLFAATDGTSIEPIAGVSARGDTPAPAAPSGVAPVFSGRTNGDLPALKARLTRSRSGDDALRRLLTGQKLAESGARDATLQRLAGYISWALADASIEAMVEMGRDSILLMEPPEHGDWLEVWREKLERGCERKARADAEQAEKNAIAASVFAGLGAKAHPDEDGTENPGPFDESRVDAWAAKHGVTREQFQHQWVIRHHGGNWIFCNGRYNKCVSDKDIDFTVRRDLGRAPVRLMMKNKDGDEVLRPMKLILFDHSTVARTVTASLALRESFYDHKAETYHEAVCPIRHELKPVEHPEIDQWLRLFGGDTLLDWVACVTRLERPAAALYIEGPKGTGKNVLADGLARLWHKGGASAFKDAVGVNFNDTLTRCPLIHADEGIPKTDTIIDDLRRLIGSSQMPLNRKFMPVVTLDGCPRLIITANNDRVLLDTGAQLGPHDIDAVTQRIRQVKAGQEAADYLTSFRETKGHTHIEGWVKDDHVARHALWLAENRQVDESTRFLVEGNDRAQAEAMTTGTGQVGAVMEFLARYLSDSSAMKTPKVRPGGGRLLVSTEALADKHQWERFVPSRKIPSARLISDSLRAVSEREPVTVEGLEFFSVKPHMLINWSRTNQVGSPVVIEAKVSGV